MSNISKTYEYPESDSDDGGFEADFNELDESKKGLGIKMCKETFPLQVVAFLGEVFYDDDEDEVCVDWGEDKTKITMKWGEYLLFNKDEGVYYDKKKIKESDKCIKILSLCGKKHKITQLGSQLGIDVEDINEAFKQVSVITPKTEKKKLDRKKKTPKGTSEYDKIIKHCKEEKAYLDEKKAKRRVAQLSLKLEKPSLARMMCWGR